MEKLFYKNAHFIDIYVYMVLEHIIWAVSIYHNRVAIDIKKERDMSFCYKLRKWIHVNRFWCYFIGLLLPLLYCQLNVY